MAELTPMMRQYLKMKQENPGCLLFFRLGDFYEMFHEDAKIGAEELGLTLTTRDRNKPEEERVPMCGVPYHSAQSYIARLIKRGYKVAICEQMEDPATAKGLVERDIVRIVTPGTAMDDVMLDESRNNFICAVYHDGVDYALARCDLSTGQFAACAFQGEGAQARLLNQLSAWLPSEAILSPGAGDQEAVTAFLRDRLDCLCQPGQDGPFRPDRARKALISCGLWREEDPLPPEGSRRLLGFRAAGALADYLAQTQKTDLSHLGPLVLEEEPEGQYMELDLTARRNLELTETLRNKEKKGSLLWVLDRTRTAMGHRMIRAWIERPLRSPGDIARRQDAVGVLVDHTVAREELALTLRQVPDLERLIGKVVYGSANARDMKLLAQGLEQHIRTTTGLVPNAYFSATKIKWILDQVPGSRQAAQRGDVLFGTVDSWLLWKLTGGAIHATDRTNASRTMLFNIETLDWDDTLLNALDIPRAMLPHVLESSRVFGTTNISGVDIPVAGIAGDQQAALFGQCCFEAGQAKNTYGTGCFLLMNTGSQLCRSQNGLVTTIAASVGSQVQYALEGSVFVGGAVIQWLRDELRFITESRDAEYYAQKVPDSGGVYIVPAFTGLGAPYWDMYARGCMVGITRGTRREHIIRAAQESIAYQSADVLAAMEKDTGMHLRELKVDGGASRDGFLMQFQADVLDCTVRRPVIRETTALGAAYLAGLAVGIWQDTRQISATWNCDVAFEPSMEPAKRSQLLEGWHRAVGRSLNWEPKQTPDE